jgi:hypothetical protein
MCRELFDMCPELVDWHPRLSLSACALSLSKGTQTVDTAACLAQECEPIEDAYALEQKIKKMAAGEEARVDQRSI